MAAPFCAIPIWRVSLSIKVTRPCEFSVHPKRTTLAVIEARHLSNWTPSSCAKAPASQLESASAFRSERYMTADNYLSSGARMASHFSMGIFPTCSTLFTKYVGVDLTLKAFSAISRTCIMSCSIFLLLRQASNDCLLIPVWRIVCISAVAGSLECAQLSAVWKSMSTTAYQFWPEQRANTKPAMDKGSDGYSRSMKRTFPVSTYFALRAGHVCL